MNAAGHVRADGTSTAILPAGVHDMVELGNLVQLTPEVEARLKALNLEPPRETSAKFKLEVYFKGGPRKGVEVRGLINAWSNGGFLNGGGDAIVYFCPHVVDAGSGVKYTCLNPIDVRFSATDAAVCTKCRTVTHPKDLVGQVINTLSTARWAQLLVRFFHVLECDTDLRMNVSTGESIIKAAALETERNRGGEVYAKHAEKREWIVYSLRSIIEDTSKGSSLETRIKAFLEA